MISNITVLGLNNKKKIYLKIVKMENKKINVCR